MSGVSLNGARIQILDGAKIVAEVNGLQAAQGAGRLLYPTPDDRRRFAWRVRSPVIGLLGTFPAPPP